MSFTQDEQRDSLSPAGMDKDPVKQFSCWFDEAEQANIPLYNAMTLATSNHMGKPSARIVLLKEIDAGGFIFYTNYGSRKARDLEGNPFASLVFCWLPLSRQVRVEGKVERVTTDESDLYFASRPRGYQVAAHASSQSHIIEDRDVLDRNYAEAAQKFAGQAVPRPAHWGGFRVLPESLEFWQEGEHRLHDRLRYRRDSAGCWVIERLAP